MATCPYIASSSPATAISPGVRLCHSQPSLALHRPTASASRPNTSRKTWGRRRLNWKSDIALVPSYPPTKYDASPVA